ncbi:MAG: MmgE/PrpD family protein [Actinobacteria bacterium]|nr:MmgE/PrpD family protein [Actinomycetota bacterium]
MFFLSVVNYKDPKTGLEGKFSFQYCLAKVLLDGKLGLAEFTDEKVREANVQKLMKKVKVYIYPELKGKKMLVLDLPLLLLNKKMVEFFQKRLLLLEVNQLTQYQKMS